MRRKKLWAVSGNCSETLAKIISPPGSQVSPGWNSVWVKSGIILTIIYWVLTMCWATPCWVIYAYYLDLFSCSLSRWTVRLILWMRKPKLREVRKLPRDHIACTLAELGLDSRPLWFKACTLNCFDGTYWVGVWEDSNEKVSQEKILTFQKAQWNLDIYSWEMDPG